MDTLREKIADQIEPSLWEGSDRDNALSLADAILQIPEIKEALDWWEMNLEQQRRDADA